MENFIRLTKRDKFMIQQHDTVEVGRGLVEVVDAAAEVPAEDPVAAIRQLLALADSADLCLIPYGGGTSVAGHINPPASTRPRRPLPP